MLALFVLGVLCAVLACALYYLLRAGQTLPLVSVSPKEPNYAEWKRLDRVPQLELRPKTKIEIPKHFGWGEHVPCNSSLFLVGSNLLVLTRCINWDGSHVTGRSDNILETRLMLSLLDVSFSVWKSLPVEDCSVRVKKEAQWLGFEDPRIYFANDKTCFFTATSFERDGGTNCQIAHCMLQYTSEKAQIVACTYLERLAVSEKNWLSFTPTDLKNPVRQAVYRCSPLTIVEYNTSNGTVKELEQTDWGGGKAPRGSAGPVEWDGGFLLLYHEGIFKQFYHSFLWLDSKRKPRKRTLPFLFQDHQVEYCCGICPLKNGDIAMAYSVADLSCTVAVLPAAALRALLKKI